jgi:hypothetical protein
MYIKGLPPTAWARLARSALQGDALNFVVSRDPNMTWDFTRLMQKLEGEFVAAVTPLAILKFEATCQFKLESVAQYCRRLESMYQTLYPRDSVLSEQAQRCLVGQAIRGVDPYLLYAALRLCRVPR